jgi:NTE family protein
VLGTSVARWRALRSPPGLPLAELAQAQCAPSEVAVTAAMGRALMFHYDLAVFAPGSGRARSGWGRLAGLPAAGRAGRRAVIRPGCPATGRPRLLIRRHREWRVRQLRRVSLIRRSARAALPGIWPPVRLNGRRWMDGGMRSAANADLAAGSERVVVLAPIWKGLRVMPGALVQCQDLVRGGSAVVLVAPDAESAAAMGRNVLDSAGRPAAARAGYAQAEAARPDVAALWSGERRPEALRPEC